MKILSLLVPLLVPACLADQAPDVEDLDASTIDSFMANHTNAIIMFYAPWCGHCKSFMPKFIEAAAALGGEKPAIGFGRVDCQKESSLGVKYSIKGYPTTIRFKNGKLTPYRGAHDTTALVSWARASLDPAVRTNVSEPQCAALSTGKMYYVLELPSFDSPLFRTYEDFADRNRVAGTFCAVVGDKETLKVKHPQEEMWQTSIAATNAAALLEQEIIPLWAVITAENLANYHDKTFSLGWVYSGLDNFDTLGEIIRPIARRFREKVAFVLLDSAKYFNHAKNALGIETNEGLVIEDQGLRYFLDPSANLMKREDVESFVEAYVAGKIPNKIKSEPVPSSQDGKVRKIVGLTFEDEVIRSDKDLLLKIHAPWCGHCVSFAPVYESIADELADKQLDVTVAEFDSWQNDLPKGWEVQGFPTIWFVPKGLKKPIPFEGDRTSEAIVSFVQRAVQTASPPTAAVSDEL